MKPRGWGFLCIVALFSLLGCHRAPTPQFHAQVNPEQLSDWGILHLDDGTLKLAEGVQAYQLPTPLFSDYAQKLRTVWLPPGEAARYSSTSVFEFPVGTVISKTFYYRRDASQGGRVQEAPALSAATLDLRAVRLIETRLLVLRPGGWVALPYVWNEAQTEARLTRAGATLDLIRVKADGGEVPFAYMVPDSNQCAGCHAPNIKAGALQPIGLKARHLPAEQLQAWSAAGVLRGLPAVTALPRTVDWTDESIELGVRARAYLDINCGHCHNRSGPADTSGLVLDASAVPDVSMGVCKPPVAAGQGTGNRRFGIVPGRPDESILLYRMESTDPGAMMPELGRHLAHDEGNALMRRWISALSGSCGNHRS
ncbi:MAG: hypothetical protein FGM43_00540 [Sinobacteraceae bacterium]|nr:hypothetical protein [Nevskiaceae bacterium]